MKAKPLPPTEYLNECFTYDPVSGKLFWKERPRSHFRTNRSWAKSNTQFAAKEAGRKRYQQNGTPSSVCLRLSGRDLTVHLIIFALMGVTIPEALEVDHKNTDPFDNSWANLRLATPSQNSANRHIDEHKKDGLPKGVTRHRNKFRARIVKNWDNIHIGIFTTPDEAHAAYCAKATELFGEFARLN